METTEQSKASTGSESSSNKSWSSATKDLKGAGRQVAEDFKRQAGEFAESQKNAGAEQIDGVARAVHGAAQQMESDHPRTASYVHEAADRIERASSSLRERSVDDLLGTFTRFVREQPILAFGGALIASMALTRFLKSSSERNYPARPQSDVGSSLSDIGTRNDDAARAAYAVGESAREGTGDRFLRFCKERPLFLVGAGVVAGAILGSSIPPTQTEDEAMGEARDRLRDRAEEIASEKYETAKETARDIYQDVQQNSDLGEIGASPQPRTLPQNETTQPGFVPAPVMPETPPFESDVKTTRTGP